MGISGARAGNELVAIATAYIDKKINSPPSLLPSTLPPLSPSLPLSLSPSLPLSLSPSLPLSLSPSLPLSLSPSLSRPPHIDPSLAQPRIELGHPALEVVFLPLC